MSTFCGKFEEIPQISVDRFDGDNLKSEAFFLSHCHTDHMEGLSYLIYSHLLSNEKYIYASEVSCAILKNRFPKSRNFKVLDMHKPTFIELEEGHLSVLPISAGHCLGSVMFLFETNSTCVLYTGDFRIHKNDIRKMKAFYDSFNKVKTIDKIYLDTTFFLKCYLKFPKREESLRETCNIIKEWIAKGPDHVIQLSTSAKYGYEDLFNEIYKEIGMPIHVNEQVYKLYSCISEMDKSVTRDGTVTQIHSSCGVFFKYICHNGSSRSIREIKLSAMSWKQNNLDNGISTIRDKNCYVCYSTHASYEEVLELIRFLKPKGIEVCVWHKDSNKNEEIRELLKEVLEELHPSVEPKEVQSEVFHPKLFQTKVTKFEKIETVKEKSSFNHFAILDSPPRERKKLKSVQKNKVQTTSYSESGSMRISSSDAKCDFDSGS